ncbi:MAG TPA: YggS family pyridoxal phosphate-dependent enzyme [Phycisphaerae bacterium]|jgi:pyridoxal phosphate enzyme (YggS family)|nr:YggS family pyridoxal phosphate-dependent enzyme [Phycisphaerae bacterium]
MNLQDRMKKVQDTIAAAAARSRRDPREILLIPVTKAATTDQVKHVIEMGCGDLGESRVQQLQQRAAQIDEWLTRQQSRDLKKPLPAPGTIRWHMIGHLQRNKVRPVMTMCQAIHSVDSLRLAEEIQEEAERLRGTPVAGGGPRTPMQVLLEVNVAGEGSKFGVAVGAAQHLAEQIDTMDDVHLIGLMCMAPFSSNPEDARPVFARLREIFEDIKFRKIGGDRFKHLSMGMSGDYPVAIEEGATMVRLGSAIFG